MASSRKPLGDTKDYFANLAAHFRGRRIINTRIRRHALRGKPRLRQIEAASSG